MIPLTNNLCFAYTKRTYNIIQNFSSMGTIGKINLITNNKIKGKQLINDIIYKISYYEKILTMFSKTSFIGKMNKNPKIEFNLPKNIIYILKLSEILRIKTNQKFNICIGNKSYLKNSNKHLIKKNTPLLININKNKAMLNDHLTIDLGSIGKGFAIEQAIKITNQHEIKNILIELGGDIKIKENNKTNDWQIKIDSINKNIDNNCINLHNTSIASSGQFIKNKISKNYIIKNHIIDPTTLSTNNYYKLTTVTGPNLTICDALSTALYNTPLQEIYILKKNFPEYNFKTFI